MFGGKGVDTEGVVGYMHDLWRADWTSATPWTWVAGSQRAASAQSALDEAILPSIAFP